MSIKLVVLVCVSVAAFGTTPGQAPASRSVSDGDVGADLQDSPQQRRRDRSPSGVYKARITPHWFGDGDRFWYRNELRGGASEYVLVDAVAGERRPAFDHERLAAALRDAGLDARPDRLALDALAFEATSNTISFRTGGKNWRCALETYELTEVESRGLEIEDDLVAIHPDDAPRASVRTGPETELRFVNATDGDVELFWLDSGGRRRSYGALQAGAERQQHTYAGHVWLAADDRGNVIIAFQAEERPQRAIISRRQVPRRGRTRSTRSASSDTSPDGIWQAFVRDDNVFVRAMDMDEELRLSEDGVTENGYQMLQWSPDSHTLAAFRVEPGDRKDVYRIESSPAGGGRAVLHRRPYALPGDKFSVYELNLFRVVGDEHSDENNGSETGFRWQPLEVDVESIDFGRPRLRWNSDGRTLTYAKVDRGHQRYRVIEIDAHSGRSRNIIDEHSDTFIWTAHADYRGVPQVTWLEETDELIYASEVDGWRHLYLVDATEPPTEASGAEPQVVNGGKRLFAPGLKNQITRGEFVVRGIDHIDEESRQIWFHASGRNADQDPYFLHYYRVNFDGSGLIALTEGNGNHSVQFSPDRRFIIDTYSRVDLPPVHELRRTEDGSLVCRLEHADISELTETGWEPPEIFVAKGRDGETDIWGIICRPADFDPGKSYPVIEEIYAGPHGSFVPKSFSGRNPYASLTELGFIVVKIDGMGTAHRSKAFHDVCWHNLKDAGFPDRILWMEQAAAKYPHMDLSRVGIYGGSAGGQSAAGALLFHPNFYRVAVAGCGCHDNRMDKASWNEQWMGYPVGEQYAECSNIDNAHRLQGKLLLIVGEMDSNVPPESTMRFVDALIKADRDFDLLVVPGAGHGMGGSYGRRRMHDFFVRHLLQEAAPAPDTGSTSESSSPRPSLTSPAEATVR